jgi:hypothetical protein
MTSNCNCKNKSPEMLEGNCICTDCNCHYFRRNDDLKDEWLQNQLRNYGMVILGTSTVCYGIYLFCCDLH